MKCSVLFAVVSIVTVTGAAHAAVVTTLDVGHDAAPGTAEAIYKQATGELFFDVGEDVSIIGIMCGEMYPDNVDEGSIFGVPVQNTAASLAYFNPDGLPVGEDSVGLVLPAGLEQDHMTFSYVPIGSPNTYVPVTMIEDGSGGGPGDPGTAEAIYNVATGELFFDIGGGISVVGIGSDVMYPANVTGSIFGAPIQSTATTLAYFNPHGLPVGEDSVGLVLPAGLSQEDMTFAYSPIGSPNTYVPVTMIPEPSTLALLAMGAIGLLAYGWRRRNVR